jgi:hypothetical protein
MGVPKPGLLDETTSAVVVMVLARQRLPPIAGTRKISKAAAPNDR